jgi:RNA polymerase sigma factor (sigma-70 family)
VRTCEASFGGSAISEPRPVLVYSADNGADAPLLAQLYRSHWAELTAYVRRTFGAGPPDPEDIAQGAFARFAALQGAEVANPRAFLYRTAHNIVMDHRRRDAVRARLSAEVALLDAGDAPANADSERVLSGKQRLAIVEAAVRAMEPRRRKVLIMHAVHGLNYTEIAGRMHISPTRVTQLFAQAVALCNKALREADEGGAGAGG